MEHQAVEGAASLRETLKVALLVDGDNVSSDLAGQILVRAGRLGRVIVKRVYLDPHHLRNWEEASGFGLHVARAGRDAADMLLAIDAVDLAHRGDLAAMVIASSDGGYAPLARYLVERGMTVLGLGVGNPALDLRRSFTRFEVMAAEPAAAAPGRTLVGAVLPATPRTLDEQVREEIAAAGPRGLPLTTFGHRMSSRNLTKANLLEASWRAYLEARSGDFDVDPKGPNARVRLKNRAPV